MNEQDLAKKLNSIPLEIGKELLWLTYKDLKPMATISDDFDWSNNPLSDQSKLNLEKENQILQWLNSAGLSYKGSVKFPHALHISKDKNLLEKNSKYELDESIEAHTFRGTAYGFGNDCAKAYAQAVQKEPMFPNDLVIHAAMVPELSKVDWYPYIGFLVRRGHEIEDAMIAKKWAEVCRKDIPEIAKEFEMGRMKDDIPFRAALQKIYS